MKTKEVITSFMADCKLRGLSEKTRREYSRHLEALPILSPQFPPKPPIIQEFLANVNGEYNRHAHFRTLRRLSNYAHEKLKFPNFMKSVTKPKLPKKIMPTISNTELNLLAVFIQNASPRDKAIICLFIDCALRVGEAVNLQRDDIKDEVIIVHGKTGYRIVPISPVTRDLLLSLPIHEDGYVFHGENNRWNGQLKESGFYKVVRRCLKKVGYKGSQYGPQVLRRSYGVFHLKDGGDIRSLQLILGHSNPNTTLNYYTPMLTEDVIAIHKRHTPAKVFSMGNAEI